MNRDRLWRPRHQVQNQSQNSPVPFLDRRVSAKEVERKREKATIK